MASGEGKITVTKSIVAFIIAALGAAFVAGVQVSHSDARASSIPLAASSIAPPQPDVVSEIHDLRAQLTRTADLMAVLNQRLSTLEGRFDERDRHR